MRRFVALPVPAEVRRALERAIAPLQGTVGDDVRWTRPEGWHVTLAFLGEVADDDVGEVVEVVRRVVAGAAAPIPAALSLGAAGRFGRSVLWASVEDDPDGSVAALGEQAQQALVQAQLPVQVQPVQPHVTLARSRRRRVDDRLVADVTVPAVAWSARSVEVWRSRLGDGPARYEVDASVPLP